MFIYTKYSRNGVESPTKLVHLLANEGIKGVCYIDENGLGVVSFLKASKKRGLKTSIAVPFYSFIEGVNEKKKGYLIVNTYRNYLIVQQLLSALQKDFIPMLTVEKIKELFHRDIYCLMQDGVSCKEVITETKIKVIPFAYENEMTKENHIKNNGKIIGCSLQEIFSQPESIIFIEGVSKDPCEFLKEYQQNNSCVELENYRNSKLL